MGFFPIFNIDNTPTSPRVSGPGKFIRLVWTIFTYIVVLIFGLIGALIGVLTGVAEGLFSSKGIWFGLRSGGLNGLLRVAKVIIGGSTWLYRKIFLKPLYTEENFPQIEVSSRFLIIGHRGAPWLRPENTISAFSKALQQGANALEIDLCLTKDGVAVIWHDWDPDSSVALFREEGQEPYQGFKPRFPSGELRKCVHELTLPELRKHYGYVRKDGKAVPANRPKTRIPTFEEFVRWAYRNRALKLVLLDLKIPADRPEFVAPMLRDIQAALAKYRPRFEVVGLTPAPEIFTALEAAEPGFPLCLDKEVVSALPLATQEEVKSFSTVLEAERCGTTYASVGRPTFLTLAPWELYGKIIQHDIDYRNQRRPDMKVIAWTINDPGELRELVAMGVDGILTDRPGRLAGKVLRRASKDTLTFAKRIVQLNR